MAGSILIVVLLVDPAPGLPDPGSEWVLLKNSWGGAIRLDGWKLHDSQSETDLPVIDLPAGASLLVAANEAGTVSGLPPVSERLSLPGRIGNGLNNLGDSLTLVDGDGNAIDALSWGTDSSVFNPAVIPEQPGTPLRRYSQNDTNSAADWRKPSVPALPGLGSTGEPALARPVSLPPTSTPVPVLPPSSSPVPILTPPGRVAIPPPQPAGMTTENAVVLSEIAPHAGWVELYNRGTSPVDLRGWSLADAQGTATMLLSGLPSLPLHGFIVVKADGLGLGLPDRNLILRRPDGSVADIVSIGRVEPDHSLSRYPAHGGGWAANTPLTAGSFNLPPEDQEPVESGSAPSTDGNHRTAGSSAPAAVSRWAQALRVVLALLGVFGVIVLLVLWRRGRGGTAGPP